MLKHPQKPPKPAKKRGRPKKIKVTILPPGNADGAVEDRYSAKPKKK